MEENKQNVIEIELPEELNYIHSLCYKGEVFINSKYRGGETKKLIYDTSKEDIRLESK